MVPIWIRKAGEIGERFSPIKGKVIKSNRVRLKWP